MEFVKSKEELGESPKSDSPFTPKIQGKPVPLSFRLPMLESYDGSSDLAEPITASRAQMALYDISDALMCHGRPLQRKPFTSSKGAYREANRHHCRWARLRGDNSSTRKAYAQTIVGKRLRHQCDPEITFRFGNEEYSDHDDALVISARITNARVKRIIVGTRSSINILYLDSCKKLGLIDKDLIPMTSTLAGFTGDLVPLLGTNTLSVTVGEEPRSKTLIILFMVVRLSSTYNAIIDLPTLNKLRAVVSTSHRTIKFLTRSWIGEARSDTRESRHCYLTTTTLPKRAKLEAPMINPRELDKVVSRPEPAKHVLEVPLNQNCLDKVVKVTPEHPMGILDDLKDFDGELPFSLTFGIEAILLLEVVYPTLRVECYKEQASEKQLRENLDLLDERRAEVC
ncbi:hypothetical protein GW17_00027148 [Ensete ventricosum]|nr:hypothetical protein GW17_00027148 [Ensete ventricosum]